MVISPLLNLLKNRIDIRRVPFSDRGSRLLTFREPDEARLFIKLAERLTEIQPDIETYLRRPPFIRDLRLIDQTGATSDLELTIYPHMLRLQTRIGDFESALPALRTASAPRASKTT